MPANTPTQPMSAFVRSYLETALWSSVDDAGEPLDASNAIVAQETVDRAIADCEKFETACELLQGFNAVRNGNIAHDFWLTRNRHGAGFWDGDYPEPIATQLTDLAHSFGECDLYIGDDGRIYAS